MHLPATSPLLNVPHPDKIRDRLQELYAEARRLRTLLPIAESVHEDARRPRLFRPREDGLCVQAAPAGGPC
jgi:hypothetical protein